MKKASSDGSNTPNEKLKGSMKSSASTTTTTSSSHRRVKILAAPQHHEMQDSMPVLHPYRGGVNSNNARLSNKTSKWCNWMMAVVVMVIIVAVVYVLQMPSSPSSSSDLTSSSSQLPDGDPPMSAITHTKVSSMQEMILKRGYHNQSTHAEVLSKHQHHYQPKVHTHHALHHHHIVTNTTKTTEELHNTLTLPSTLFGKLTLPQSKHVLHFLPPAVSSFPSSFTTNSKLIPVKGIILIFHHCYMHPEVWLDSQESAHSLPVEAHLRKVLQALGYSLLVFSPNNLLATSTTASSAAASSSGRKLKQCWHNSQKAIVMEALQYLTNQLSTTTTSSSTPQAASKDVSKDTSKDASKPAAAASDPNQSKGTGIPDALLPIHILALLNAGNFVQHDVLSYLHMNLPEALVLKSLLLMNTKLHSNTAAMSANNPDSNVRKKNKRSQDINIFVMDMARNADLTSSNVPMMTIKLHEWMALTTKEKHTLLRSTTSDVFLHAISEPFPITKSIWMQMSNRTFVYDWLQRQHPKFWADLPWKPSSASSSSGAGEGTLKEMISYEEASALHNTLSQEGFLWFHQHPLQVKANSIGAILIKDPTDPIYVEHFKRILKMSIPRLSRVVDAIPSQGFNAYDRLHEDESKVKALQSTVPDFSHQIQTLKWIWQVVKHAWAYRETNDEYIPQVVDWLHLHDSL